MLDSFNDFSKINTSVLKGYDYIIHFTYYTSHSVSFKLDGFLDKVVYMNSGSIDEFEKVIMKL